MAEAGELQVAMGLEQNFRPVGDAAFGLADIAEFGLSIQRERSDCSDCKETTLDRTLSLAYFKLGTPEGLGHAAVPAVAVIFRKTLPKSAQIFSGESAHVSVQEEETPIAIVSAVASKTLGPVALHIGADLLAAQRGLVRDDALTQPTIRPAIGIHYVPPAYPATTLLSDVHWIPSLDSSGQWGTVWNAAAGVRYQALDWASVDLNIRLQEAQGAGDALVVLGFRGSFDLTDDAKTRL